MDGQKKGLPGWAFMVAGVLVMLYTKFIQSKQPASKIGIFFWIGLVLVVFGVMREAGSRLKVKKPQKEMVGPPLRQQQPVTAQTHPAMHQYQASPHQTHSHVMPQQHPSHPYQPVHKQCPRCMKLTHGQARFCHTCGHQFY